MLFFQNCIRIFLLFVSEAAMVYVTGPNFSPRRGDLGIEWCEGEGGDEGLGIANCRRKLGKHCCKSCQLRIKIPNINLFRKSYFGIFFLLLFLSKKKPSSGTDALGDADLWGPPPRCRIAPEGFQPVDRITNQWLKTSDFSFELRWPPRSSNGQFTIAINASSRNTPTGRFAGLVEGLCWAGGSKLFQIVLHFTVFLIVL